MRSRSTFLCSSKLLCARLRGVPCLEMLAREEGGPPRVLTGPERLLAGPERVLTGPPRELAGGRPPVVVVCDRESCEEERPVTGRSRSSGASSGLSLITQAL